MLWPVVAAGLVIAAIGFVAILVERWTGDGRRERGRDGNSAANS